MKKIISIILLLVSGIFAQGQNYSLTWNGNVASIVPTQPAGYVYTSNGTNASTYQQISAIIDPDTTISPYLRTKYNAYNTSGNTGCNSYNNFLGYTDTVYGLQFKLGNRRSGWFDTVSELYLGYMSGYKDKPALKTYNEGLGLFALYTNTTANRNLAVGDSALYLNNGNRNNAIGFDAMNRNSSGNDNVFSGTFAGYYSNNSYCVGIGNYCLYFNQADRNYTLGFEGLYHNLTGNYNVAVGYNPSFHNTTGQYNDVIGGDEPFFTNTTGSYNEVMGSLALFSNTTGQYNVAIGYQALNLATIATWNVAVGYNALSNDVKGNGNTFMGYEAGLYVTGHDNTGVGWATQYWDTASYNTSLGFHALTGYIGGYGNTAVGSNCMFDNPTNATGSTNTAVGDSALVINSTGNNNTAVGAYTLLANTSGSSNTAIGYKANATETNLTNTTAIGNGANATASNQVVLGNSAVTFVQTYGEIKGLSSTPSISAGTGAGTSPTVSDSGSVISGKVVVTTGAAPTGSNAIVAIITFPTSFPNGSSVVLYPQNAATSILSGVTMVYTSSGKGSWQIISGATALITLTTYEWSYTASGW